MLYETFLPFIILNPGWFRFWICLSKPKHLQSSDVTVDTLIFPSSDVFNVVGQYLCAEVSNSRIVIKPAQHFRFKQVDSPVGFYSRRIDCFLMKCDDNTFFICLYYSAGLRCGTVEGHHCNREMITPRSTNNFSTISMDSLMESSSVSRVSSGFFGCS